MIHIEGDWYILVDELCYTLQKKIGKRIDKETGEEKDVWSDARYYSTLYKAIQGYFRARTVEFLYHRVIELKTALEELLRLNKHIDELLKEILREE